MTSSTRSSNSADTNNTATQDSPVVDAPQRAEALDINRSFCVQAPAGSGKTELLTQRILKLLPHCEQPENILAITFTRKAAAEMRNRLLDSLRKALNTSPEEALTLPAHAQLTLELANKVLAHDKAMNWQLLANPSRLNITTIDSYNHSLASQLPLLSSFGAKPEITDEPEKLYDEAVLSLLKRLEEKSELSEALARLLTHLDNNIYRLHQLLSLLLSKREQWLSHVLFVQSDSARAKQYLQDSLVSLVSNSLEQLHHLIGDKLASLCSAMTFASIHMAEAGTNHAISEYDFGKQPDTDPASLGKWQAMISLMMTADKKGLRKTVDKRNGFPVEKTEDFTAAELKAQKQSYVTLLKELAENPDLLESLIQVAILPNINFDTKQWEVLHALTTVLYYLSGELALVFQKHNQCDYTQVSASALQALGSDEEATSIALRLDYTLQHIMVDEFQDTSYLQINLLNKLTQGWANGDGRSLFIVGDGMQSCYGFRNANVGLFLDVQENGLGDIKLDNLKLQVNFRSEVEVVEWVNQIFSTAFPQHNDISRGAVTYNPSVGIHQRGQQERTQTGVQVFALYGNKENATTAQLRQAEAQHTIQLIQRIQSNDPEADIALLIRGRNHIVDILPALKEQGIAWNATELDSLSAYTDIQDLMTLLSAILNPADNTAWLALLRCPFVGLSMQDIHTLSVEAQKHSLCLWQVLQNQAKINSISEEGLTILQRVIPHLNSARKNRSNETARQWLETLWLNLGGPAALSEEIDDTHIDAFFALLESEEQSNQLVDVQSLQNALNAKRVNSKADANAKVQIMTLHKAKGLEFDYVIIPRLNDGGKSDNGALLQWQEYITPDSEPKLLLSIPEERGAESDPLHNYLKAEAAYKEKLERTRLLYIGVTRAIKKAYLIGSLSVDEEKPASIKPKSNSLLACIWDSLLPLDSYTTIIRPEFELAEAGKESKSDRQTTPQIITRRLPVQWQHPAPIFSSSASSTFLDSENEPEKTDTEDSESDSLFSSPNLTERLRGDIVHECLCLASEGKLNLKDENALKLLSNQWHLRLSAISDQHLLPEKIVQEIYTQLNTVANSEQGAWILDTLHQDSHSELAISDYSNDWRSESIIDRTFIDEKNQRWIIDYKTSSPKASQSQDEFLAEQGNTYLKQLDRYSRLFHQMEPERPVITALYFPAIDILHRLN